MNKLVSKLLSSAHPYCNIGQGPETYMERWWLKMWTAEDPISIRLHYIRRSDTDRAMHDHPWATTSIILDGHFVEVTPEDQKQEPAKDRTNYKMIRYEQGSVISRKPTDRHRLIVPPGGVWTMFFMGAYEQMWGFYDMDLNKKVPWREYLGNSLQTAESSSDRQREALAHAVQQALQSAP